MTYVYSRGFLKIEKIWRSPSLNEFTPIIGKFETFFFCLLKNHNFIKKK